jgi:eukaryotic-like serine/threonine-protein kinase
MPDSPPRLGDLSPEERNRLESVIDRFEEDWARGERRALESYLPADCGERGLLLRELVLVERELKNNAGETMELDSYTERFPELRDADFAAAFTHCESSEKTRTSPGLRTEGPRAHGAANDATSRFSRTTRNSVGFGERSAPVIPGYDLLEELGRGGMGVVYKARQARLNRLCALKMILAGDHASPETTARFLAEAGIVARLRHPNVVHIHALGEHEGRPFFEMELVEGGSLDRQLDGAPRPALDAARLVEPLARAVAEAHKMGIIHRDLKPANVLLAADGSPKVTDFGLAKCLDADSGLTGSELVMGTPSYMAPEQAGGITKTVGPESDVYSLGAILYELLTGRPPFRAPTVLETLEQVKNAEPVAPSRLAPGMPRDPETICLKCLRKDPARRYESANALANDLKRYLNGETILARPVGPLERGWRWARRRPAVAVSAAALVLTLVMLAASSTLVAWTVSNSAREVESAFGREKAARREAERALADMSTSRGLLADERGDPAQAMLWFAHAALQSRGDDERIRDNLLRVESWSRGTPMPIHAFTHDGQPLEEMDFSRDGRFLLCRGSAGRRVLWDLKDGSSVAWAAGEGPAKLDPDGVLCALETSVGQVEVRTLATGESRARIAMLGQGRIRCLGFSPDGRFLALSRGTYARVWDTKTRAYATPEIPHPDVVTQVVFAPRSDHLATACRDGFARIFPVKIGTDVPQPLFPPAPHQPLRSWLEQKEAKLLFSAGGKLILTMERPDKLVCRDAITGAAAFSRVFPQGNVFAQALGPAGRRLTVGGWCWVQTIDLDSGELGASFPHRQQVEGLAVSPDAGTLLTLCDDHIVRFWSANDPTRTPTLLPHQAGPNLAAYSADGRLLATAQKDGLVRVWRLSEHSESVHEMAQELAHISPRLSTDGGLVIPGRPHTTYIPRTRRLRVHDVATGEARGPLLESGGPIQDAALAPDGRSAVLAVERSDQGSDARGAIEFWSLPDGKRIRAPLRLSQIPDRIAFSPDGALLAVAEAGPVCDLIDVSRGAVRQQLNHELMGARTTGSHLCFAPDGRTLITSVGRMARVWDVAAGSAGRQPLIHAREVSALASSPDSRRCATATVAGELRVWDLATGEAASNVMPHGDWIFQARFSPDGRYLAAACRNGSAEVWDWSSSRLACSPLRHDDEVWSVAFTADSQRLLTTSRDGTLRVWELKSGKPLTPGLVMSRPAGCDGVDVTPDGAAVVVGWAFSGMASFPLRWMLPPSRMAADAWATVGELASGRRIHQGETVGLNSQEWLDRWAKLKPPQSRLAAATAR